MYGASCEMVFRLAKNPVVYFGCMLFKKTSHKERPKLELLGIGSALNRKLKANLLEALAELSLDMPVEEVTEIDKLLQYDISGIPALAINGKVLFQQEVPSVSELRQLLINFLDLEPKDIPMKKILVPTDFSAPAGNALDYAIAIANAFGSKITLLHTYKVYSSAGMFLSVESIIQQDAVDEINKIIAQNKPKLELGVTIEGKVLRGDAVSVIADLADLSEYDLIVMGTKGATGLREVFIGSVTNGVIRNTRTPVLAIPESAVFKPLETFVLAIDNLKLSSGLVVDTLLNLAQRFHAKVKIYHKDTGEADQGIDPSVDQLLEPVEHSFHYELKSDNGTIPSIDDFVADNGADLLCMVHRSRNLVDEVFHVSATSKEAFHTKIPLLVLHD